MIIVALVLTLLVSIPAGLAWRASASMRRQADGRLLASLDELNANALIVVLGCPARNRNGTRNRLLDERIASAAAAYHHRVAHARAAEHAEPPPLSLVCSGWDARGEATEMRQALLAAGVESDAIEVDGGSARTIDSVRWVVRRHSDRPVVFVSQRFHLTRALHLALGFGLDATGLPAAGGLRGVRPRLREALAVLRARYDARRAPSAEGVPPTP